MTNNFNFVAPFYDQLARLIYGRKLKSMQQLHLGEIPNKAKVLIVGGGTGEVLEWLPRGLALQVDYVELSDRMIKKAMKREVDGNEVSFKRMDARDVSDRYDVVIANFFLDCFSTTNLNRMIVHLTGLLQENGKLLVTDFALPITGKQRFLSGLMHTFFRLATRLESKGLHDIHQAILENGFEQVRYKTDKDGLLFSGIYKIINPRKVA